MPTPCAIFDVDGTLADCRHRLPLIRQDPPDWEGFFAAADRDLPFPYVVQLARSLARDLSVIVVTGRPERFRELTEDWLRKYDVPFRELHLRPDNYRRPDVEYKAGVLRGLRYQDYAPLLAVEDRPAVVRRYREEGLGVLAVDPHDWETTHTTYDGAPA